MPPLLTQTVRREIVAMGGRATVSGVTTVEQIKTIIGQEILVGTFPLFPLIATGMLLTAAGIYGVLAFAVSRRATELAVRWRSARPEGICCGWWPRTACACLARRHRDRHRLDLCADARGAGPRRRV